LYHGFVASLVCGGLGDESWSWRRYGGVCRGCAREWRDKHDGGSMRVEAIGVEMRHSLKESHGGCFKR
jgi:hypothetical protein